MDPDTKDLLKSTGKLIVGEAAEIANMFTLGIPKTILEQHVEKKVAERLKPNLSRKSPVNQMWGKIRLGMSEEQVGRLLGLPEAIESYKTQVGKVDSTVWNYDRGYILQPLQGSVQFKNQRVTYFRVFHRKKGGHWIAGEAPPTAWLKERQKECRSGEPGTIL